jgi:2-keto-4-pentenoate hydratase
LIDPFESLAGLTAHARERGVTLRRGEIVSTGSLTSVFDVAQPEAEIVAQYLDASLRVTLRSS